MTVPVFILLIHLLTFIPTLHQDLFPSLDFCASLLALMSLFHSLSLLLSPHFCAFIQTFLYSVLLFHFIPSLLLFSLSVITHLFMCSILFMSYGPMFYLSIFTFHIFFISCTVNDLQILTAPTNAQVYYYVLHF